MKYLNHERTLSHYIDNTTKKLFKHKGFYLFKLMSEWEEIIPKEYGDYCFPIAMKKNKSHMRDQSNSYVLELEIYDSTIVFELQYNQEQIISDINNYFNQPLFTALKFALREKMPVKPPSYLKQKPKSSNDLSQANINNHDYQQLIAHIDSISDENIRAKLQDIALKISK